LWNAQNGFRKDGSFAVIIGFGFGSPLTAILMLIGTSLLSYLVFRLFAKSSRQDKQPTRAELRQYYYEQRRRVRELAEQFDLTDEQIEQKINEQLGPPKE
jgi:hypothetical protein